MKKTLESRDERGEEWRNVAPKIEGEDLALAHRGMPGSYFRPSLPPHSTETRLRDVTK